MESSASKIAANDDDDIRELDVTTLRRRACSSNGFPVDVCLEGVPPKGASWMNCEDVVFYDELSMVDCRLDKYRLNECYRPDKIVSRGVSVGKVYSNAVAPTLKKGMMAYTGKDYTVQSDPAEVLASMANGRYPLEDKDGPVCVEGKCFREEL